MHKSKGDKIRAAKRLRKFGADKRAKTKWPIQIQMFWRWANNNNGNRRQKKVLRNIDKNGQLSHGKYILWRGRGRHEQ